MTFNRQDTLQRLQGQETQRTEGFDLSYWTYQVEKMKKNSGSLDVENKSINFPTNQIPNKEALWNDYLARTAKRGVSPNYNQFLTNYNMFKKSNNDQIMNLINSARNLGFSDNDIKDSLADRNATNSLQEMYLNSDPETQAQLGDLLKEKKGFWKTWGDRVTSFPEKFTEWSGENPNMAMAAMLASPYAGYKGVQKFRNWRNPEGAVPVSTTTEKTPTTKTPKYTGVKKSTIKAKYQTYLNEYKGDIKKRQAPRTFEQNYRANHRAEWDKKNKSSTKPPSTQSKPKSSFLKRLKKPSLSKAYIAYMLYDMLNSEE